MNDAAPVVPASDAGGTSAAIADGSNAPASCNTITNDAVALASIDMVAAVAPTPTGGAILDGTYHLTGITLYAGAKGNPAKLPISLKGTVSVHGNVVDQVLDGAKNGGAVIAERTSETFTTSGSTVTYTMTCPTSKATSGTYSATGTSLTLFLVNDAGQTVGYTYAP